jgi:putative two-component system response regulator
MNETALKNARIMIVDDQPLNTHLLERMLRLEGYKHIVSLGDSTEVCKRFIEIQPDILLLDLHMPDIDGFEIMKILREHVPDYAHIPVLAITGDIMPETKLRALAAGARDFISKPFDMNEVALRIKNLLETRFLCLQLQSQNRELESKVRERTQQLKIAQAEILQRLALAAEFRDDEAGQHPQRVGELAAALAREIGLDEQQVELIRLAAPLHDIGKIGIPEHILRKPSSLTDDEMEIIRQHTSIGAKILSSNQHDLLIIAEEIARTHHERWDGSGYPLGLAGEDIPLSGRVVAVADAFDALRHARPYKPAWQLSQTLSEIERQSGTKFDPQVVAALLRLYGKPATVSQFDSSLELHANGHRDPSFASY